MSEMKEVDMEVQRRMNQRFRICLDFFLKPFGILVDRTMNSIRCCRKKPEVKAESKFEYNSESNSEIKSEVLFMPTTVFRPGKKNPIDNKSTI